MNPSRHFGFFFLLATLAALLAASSAPAATIQVLSPAGSPFGDAYGIDGNNVVGTTGSVGFLYNGSTYTKIAVPGAAYTVPRGISGSDIVGYYRTSTGFHGFLFNGSSYTTLEPPTAATGTTTIYGISGNIIVGAYGDATGHGHGFVYDGSTWMTIDDPSAVTSTSIYGASGKNLVGDYLDAGGLEYGFLYNGSSWQMLADPAGSGAGYTQAYGVSGNTVVGMSEGGGFMPHGFLYDGSTYSYPLPVGFSGFQNGSFQGGYPWFGYWYNGISGNKIVGSFRDTHFNVDRPFILTIPEPATLSLSLLGGLALLMRLLLRNRSSPRNSVA